VDIWGDMVAARHRLDRIRPLWTVWRLRESGPYDKAGQQDQDGAEGQGSTQQHSTGDGLAQCWLACVVCGNRGLPGLAVAGLGVPGGVVHRASDSRYM